MIVYDCVLLYCIILHRIALYRILGHMKLQWLLEKLMNTFRLHSDTSGYTTWLACLTAVGKGQMGSELMGSLHMLLYFDWGIVCIPNCQNLPISVGVAYLFPQSVKTHYFCSDPSDPISVDPICPQPRQTRESPSWSPRTRSSGSTCPCRIRCGPGRWPRTCGARTTSRRQW